MSSVYNEVLSFKKKFPGGVSWRVRSHAEVVQKHLNPGEEIEFVFTGQKNDKFYDLFRTCVVVLTNKRILIGQKRLLWGYFLSSVTPDLYNDLLIYQGLIWGKVVIDTIKEEITITNLPKSSLDAIETHISEMMMREKQKYKAENK